MPESARLLLALVVALAVSTVVTEWFRRWALRQSILDQPNERSSHATPVPRGGGVGIVGGFLAGLLVWVALGGVTSVRTWGLLAGALLVSGVSFADDLRGLPATVRLVAHVVAAGLLTLAGVQGTAEPITLVLLPLAFLWVVATTNIYNFMDGIDGLAAAQGIVAGATFALAGTLLGNPLVGTAGALLACACAGFLPHNLPPARVFMGDVSSTFLGFTFAGLALLGNLGVGGARMPLELGVFALAPFLFDGVATLCRRVLRGERWFEAHRSHYYQRLVRGGWTHGQTTMLYATLAAVSGALGVLGALSSGEALRWLLLAAALLPMLLVVALVARVEQRGASAAHSARPSL